MKILIPTRVRNSEIPPETKAPGTVAQRRLHQPGSGRTFAFSPAGPTMEIGLSPSGTGGFWRPPDHAAPGDGNSTAVRPRAGKLACPSRLAPNHLGIPVGANSQRTHRSEQPDRNRETGRTIPANAARFSAARLPWRPLSLLGKPIHPSGRIWPKPARKPAPANLPKPTKHPRSVNEIATSDAIKRRSPTVFRLARERLFGDTSRGLPAEAARGDGVLAPPRLDDSRPIVPCR